MKICKECSAPLDKKDRFPKCMPCMMGIKKNSYTSEEQITIQWFKSTVLAMPEASQQKWLPYIKIIDSGPLRDPKKHQEMITALNYLKRINS